MIVWEIKIGGKTALKMTDEGKARQVVALINDGGVYDVPAEVVDSRGPRKPHATAKASITKKSHK